MQAAASIIKGRAGNTLRHWLVGLALVLLAGTAQAAITVSLTAPANNTVVAAPGSFTITASASVTQGSPIQTVSFYAGTTLLGTITAPPGPKIPALPGAAAGAPINTTGTTTYTWNWTNVPMGIYSLTAVATDKKGISATSAPVTVIADVPPTVSLTGPANNTVVTAPATFTLSAKATAPIGTITKVEYYNGATLIGTATIAPYTFSWASIPYGTYSITAKATDNWGFSNTTAPITVISNQPPTTNLTAPAANTVITAPATFTLAANAADIDGTVAKVDFYATNTKTGALTVIGTATAAPYTINWANVPYGSYSLTSVATDNYGASTTSPAIPVISNQPPTVNLTSPAANTVITAPATFTLAANAADIDGTIAKVDFYATNTKTGALTAIGTATAAPYTINWANVPYGSYSITSVATDNYGASTTSPAIPVISNQPPSISLNSPTNNVVAIAPGSFSLLANASDVDGSIAKIEFYNGNTLISTSTAGTAGIYTWNNVPAGIYTITAKATDNYGATTTSTQATVISDIPPTVNLISPAANAIAKAPATFNIIANASSSMSTIAKVVFYANKAGSNTLIGTATTATSGAYSFIWSNVPAGSYSITAVATDSYGIAATSAAVSVTSGMPDLVMTAVSSTTTKINTLGGPILIADTIKNQGQVYPTTTVRVGYYLSTDNVITTSDTFLGYRPVDRSLLAAGASNVNPQTWATVPAGMAPGTYYLGAIADYNNVEAESDETNNGLAGMQFTIALPDLVMTAVSSTTTKISAGSMFLVADTIKNQGAVYPTTTVRVGYYLSTDNVITTSDTFLGYRPVDRSLLAAGASNVNPQTWATVPAGAAPGTYYLGAIADYDNAEAESDETNNTLSSQMIAVGPDLVMTSVSSTSAAAIPGNSISIADTLTNQGGGATTTSCRMIGYYLSSDNIITSTDTLIGSRQYCGALAAGATNTNTGTSITIPAGTPIGTYYLGAIADYTGVEAESDETNNTILAGSTLLLAQLPAAPANVNAIGSYTKATVNFSAPASDGGAAISGYTVTSTPAGGFDINAGRTSLSHIVRGLTNGATYNFTVRASNAVGSSLASVTSNSVIPGPTSPDVPANVSAVSGYTKAIVRFAVPDANGSPIIGYTVTSSPGGVTAICTTSPCVDTGLTEGTAYTFTVTATNAIGTSAPSAPSNSVIPAPTAPDAPTKVKAAGGNTQAIISFAVPAANGSPISGYTVTSSPSGITASGAGSPITVKGLTNGTAYTFTVTATNGIGTSDPSVPSNRIIAMVLPLAYYIYTDHLDTPRQITDTAGNIVWAWDNSDPFGNNPPNENPSGQGQFTCNLRFPGQFFDIETGLFYNINRNYDPASGRYVESDPIGLYGGSWSTYAYVNSNPLSYVDPLGLAYIETSIAGGTTTFNPVPYNAEIVTITTRVDVTSTSLPGAGDPFTTPDTEWVPTGKKSRAFGPDGAYINTGDSRGRNIHGGGSCSAAPFADRQGWCKTYGCTRGQNEDVIRLGKAREEFKKKYPKVRVPYIRY